MFLNALKYTGVYNSEEIKLFEKEVKQRNVQAKEKLLARGEVAKCAYFLITGAMYQIRSDSSVVELHLENEWFLNAESFISQIPSDRDIVAYTQSSILEVSVEAIHYLIGKSTAFLQLNNILRAMCVRISFFDHMVTPFDKYQFILDNNPELIQRFPLKMIASYLKMTPETLSRVRNKLVKGIS
ncbi:MAG: Crp/Fnr family transcriptional regulator [Mangrovibacterium sp.]